MDHFGIIIICCGVIVVASVALHLMHLLRCKHVWANSDAYHRRCLKCDKDQVLTGHSEIEASWQDVK